MKVAGRLYSLDLIRVWACMLVVFLHCNNDVLWLDVLTMPCNVLFFMVSGALLLPTNMSTIAFYKRRLMRILGPTLFFSLFYLTLDFAFSNSLTWDGYFRSIMQIPLIPQGNVVLWFMYAMMGVYIFMPILSAWLQQANRHEVELLLCLWIISCILPVISGGKLTSAFHNSQFYYVGGYAGFSLLGYYLMNYSIKIGRFFAAIMIIAVSLLTYFGSLMNIPLLRYNGLDNFSFATILIAVGWFVFFNAFLEPICKQPDRIKKGVVIISQCAFGIYLIHGFIKDIFNPVLQLLINNSQLMSVTLALVTFSVSLLICIAISSLPFSEYIIGFRRKKSS